MNLPDFAAHIPCDSASPQVICTQPAAYRVVMHPPKSATDTGCGHHVTLLCQHCIDVVATNIRKTLTAKNTPQPVCPVCDMRFYAVTDIMQEVRSL
ncbi:hypothetical protein [Gordonia rubripertincta]|uniref:Uncharacterized protein n=2 Tax=Fairfaxidumvirus TaxID=2731207 RepID=A0A5J6TBE6_9CAUD|nr:hypothetical protein [Gordonia rubripertincta]YP_010001208.1 tail fiber protein [Gordonia phage Toast]YP_010001292.1 tail fiber protein [Gordonia phage William]UVF60579.1 hypothetical protein SEA_PCORAL7_71 [Gordonia phage PCoral7]QDF17169.1 hypothetical protein SEA_WILLIAM_74 [Gordonia phage William]QFG08130.1 hypothetical protein PBI_TOAST_71 [Gordonia phage Toast]QMU19024.1 hypothetical protein H3V45_12980 [Gordonia rubripertincta]